MKDIAIAAAAVDNGYFNMRADSLFTLWGDRRYGVVVKDALIEAKNSSKPSLEKEVERAVSTNKSGQIVLRIHAKPGAKLSTVTDVGESEVGVAIGAPPREGQANEELLDYMSKLLGLRKSELDFDKGAKSRSKILLITSQRISMEQVIEKLNQAAKEG